jgi:hypothetical protein
MEDAVVAESFSIDRTRAIDLVEGFVVAFGWKLTGHGEAALGSRL